MAVFHVGLLRSFRVVNVLPVLTCQRSAEWLMIGRRKCSGSIKPPSLWVTFSDWACDYHFRTTRTVFHLVGCLSKVWNIILMLHGLDIDFQSGMVDQGCFSPSMMNQVVARRSLFASWKTFRSGEKIEVVDSTIGLRAVLSAGIKVHRSVIRTFGEVQESTYDDNFFPGVVTTSHIIVDELRSLLFFATFCISFVPSFEAYLFVSSRSGGSHNLMMLGTLLAVVVFFLIRLAMALLTQAMAVVLMKHKASCPHLASSWYQVLIHVYWFNVIWGHGFLLFGTPFFNVLARIMGASIEGELLFNGRMMHDFHALTFREKTIIDECQISAHVQIGNDMTVEPSIHSGVLHEGCFTLAGSHCDRLQTTEYGPLRPIFGKDSVVLDGGTI
uniref:Uncharacterized protein n=1 Tax=Grammatophora oceanica TaxID=210454 RepID=A0A7S1Y5P3_9STRA|mmetsp:Transcript_23291/g.34515  ORF Transcript_23291/g.34515 Transcript_23291/m.34515 type:complete len:385 (+) Transcript_23291:741-1895(+)